MFQWGLQVLPTGMWPTVKCTATEVAAKQMVRRENLYTNIHQV